MPSATYQIRDHGVIIPNVLCFYPVKEVAFGYKWGFRYENGAFEFFRYKNREDAERERQEFIDAIEDYYR